MPIYVRLHILHIQYSCLPGVRKNNTDETLVIVNFCPQREYTYVTKSPFLSGLDVFNICYFMGLESEYLDWEIFEINSYFVDK